MVDNSDEKTLVEKVQAGDISAFSVLVKRYQEKMLHVAYSFLGNREEAKDAAQEAFVKAYDGLSKFKGGSQFSTWLYRILANVCKDHLRKKKVRRNLLVVPRVKEEEEEIRAEDKIPSLQPGALDSLVSRELGNTIYQAMELLPQQQRSAFALRYLEGMSLLEIAGVLHLSEGAVKAHLWQAVQKMQKYLMNLEVL